MFTPEQRDAVRSAVLRLADADARVVAGAVVGSLAVEGGGDRFSDLDLTFAVVDGVPVLSVLDSWTDRLAVDVGAVHLADLDRPPTPYRVLLLPDALQLDLSMTPAADFRPAGPRFRLLFGAVAPSPTTAAAPRPGWLSIPTPVVPSDLFGWGVIYALHARACIERSRLWQAEHYVAAVRDHALALACLREGVTVAQARGYDDLSASTLAAFRGTHVGSLERGVLQRALAASVSALLREGTDAQLPHAGTVAHRLADLPDDYQS